MIQKKYDIKAVLFDFDGTLTKPGSLDFKKIKTIIGCPETMPVLEYIEGINDPEEKRKATVKLDQLEMEAAKKSVPNLGAESMISFLCSNNIPIGIISRNSLLAIRTALKNFKLAVNSDFSLIISRDDPVKPKPSAEAILKAASDLKIKANQIAMVGDFIFDMEAGRAAGAFTVFLNNGQTDKYPFLKRDVNISHLEELKQILFFTKKRPREARSLFEPK